MTTTAKVGKKGNSLFVYFPQMFSNSMHLHKGEELELELRGDELVIRKNEHLTVDDLLEGITPDYAQYLNNVAVPLEEIERLI